VADEKKRDKIEYTVPKLAPLSQGDHLVSEGGGCSPGTGDAMPCNLGSHADTCSAGSSVSYCSAGAHASGSGCSPGTGAVGTPCNTGGSPTDSCWNGSYPVS
jgi:hypothetical protein